MSLIHSEQNVIILLFHSRFCNVTHNSSDEQQNKNKISHTKVKNIFFKEKERTGKKNTKSRILYFLLFIESYSLASNFLIESNVPLYFAIQSLQLRRLAPRFFHPPSCFPACPEPHQPLLAVASTCHMQKPA